MYFTDGLHSNGNQTINQKSIWNGLDTVMSTEIVTTIPFQIEVDINNGDSLNIKNYSDSSNTKLEKQWQYINGDLLWYSESNQQGQEIQYNCK
jgi:hypothetical protein